MKKIQYLADFHVSSFVEWMSQNIDSSTFEHRYLIRSNRRSWSCKSLSDACNQYDWPHPPIERLCVPGGSTFESNAKALRALEIDLKAALVFPYDDGLACIASIDVMYWGGVQARNAKWLADNREGLAKLLAETGEAFESGDASHPLICKSDFRFNAGMTKIYSLICSNFVIYDSRVAAALGWAVTKFCEEKSLSQVPDGLRFPWSPAKESETARNPKRRNPGKSSLQFPRLRTGRHHAEWNLKANWVLDAVINHPNSVVSDLNKTRDLASPLRALEAALFMIGYDLGVP